MILLSVLTCAGLVFLFFLSDTAKVFGPPAEFLSVLADKKIKNEKTEIPDSDFNEQGTFIGDAGGSLKNEKDITVKVPDSDKGNNAEPDNSVTEGGKKIADNSQSGHMGVKSPVANDVKKDAVDSPSFQKEADLDKSSGAEKPYDKNTAEYAVNSGDSESDYDLLVFVFDDGGHNLKDLTPIVSLPFPVSIAVLPGLGYSVKAAELVRTSGKELILHQPMQAKNLSLDPGPGAIKPGMGYSDIIDLLIDNTNQVGPVVGMNNHEGSLITEDPELMIPVLEFCRERGLIFLDSRTTSETVVPEQAAKLYMDYLERSVFIDNIQEHDAIISSIREGMNVARKNGSAVLIGHVWCQSIADIILEVYPEILEQGYRITTLTELLNYKANEKN